MVQTRTGVATPPASTPTTFTIDPSPLRTGRDVLDAILTMAHAAKRDLLGEGRGALRGCLRGTGPGVSFTDCVNRLESEHPLSLQFPFEGSERVGGAVWRGSEHDCTVADAGLAKLQWKGGADDLPMHTHTCSDRFIMVLRGRGFYHVSRQSAEHFDGTDVQTIAARERDVFLFTRDVVHTFSTTDHDMILLSVQLPFIPFDAPDQYTLPAFRWTAREHLRPASSRIALTSGWTQLV